MNSWPGPASVLSIPMLCGPHSNHHSVIKRMEGECGGPTPVELRWDDPCVPLQGMGRKGEEKDVQNASAIPQRQVGTLCSTACLCHSLSLPGPTPLTRGLPHPPSTAFPFGAHMAPPPLPALRTRCCYQHYCPRTAHDWPQLTVRQNLTGLPDCFRFLSISQAPSSSCSPTAETLQL